jgi:DNA-binding phage protein
MSGETIPFDAADVLQDEEDVRGFLEAAEATGDIADLEAAQQIVAEARRRWERRAAP